MWGWSELSDLQCDISIKQSRKIYCFGGVWGSGGGGVEGHLQRRRLENVFGQPEQHRRILGRTRPLWHMQQRHNELYYNYKAQSVEVDNIDIWPGKGGRSVLLHRDRATPQPISIQITLT